MSHPVWNVRKFWSPAQIAVLPELFNSGYVYSSENYRRAENADGLTANWLRQTARTLVLEPLRNGIESLDIEHHLDDAVLSSQFKAMAEYYDNIKHAHTGVFDVRTAC